MYEQWSPSWRLVVAKVRIKIMEQLLKAQDAKALVQCMLTSMVTVESNDLSSQKMNIERLHTLKSFLTQTISEISRLISNTNSDEAMEICPADEVLVVVADAQLVEPRGRFSISLSSNGILCQGTQANFFVRWTQISHCACVPNSTSTKKEGEELMAFLFAVPIKYNNKEIKSFLWNLNKSELKKITTKCLEPEMEISGTEHFVVSMLMSKLCGTKVMIPNNLLFQSATLRRPFLKCYRGIQEGSLYPLHHGLIFLRPLLLIPIESIASLTAGRGGGSSSTRYIDLMVSPVTPDTQRSMASFFHFPIALFSWSSVGGNFRREAARIHEHRKGGAACNTGASAFTIALQLVDVLFSASLTRLCLMNRFT